jgi:ankyrin repeat protein
VVAIDGKDGGSWSLLHSAVDTGNIQWTEELLERGEAQSQDDKGRSPLDLAAQKGNIEILTLLAEHFKVPVDPMVVAHSISTAGTEPMLSCQSSCCIWLQASWRLKS